jgi:hypothetical protein
MPLKFPIFSRILKEEESGKFPGGSDWFRTYAKCGHFGSDNIQTIHSVANNSSKILEKIGNFKGI